MVCGDYVQCMHPSVDTGESLLLYSKVKTAENEWNSPITLIDSRWCLPYPYILRNIPANNNY